MAEYVAINNTGVADLFITFASGSKVPVQLKRGQILPKDLLDPADLNKSLQYGALGRLISSNWIKQVEDLDEAQRFSAALSRVLPTARAAETAKPLSQIRRENAETAERTRVNLEYAKRAEIVQSMSLEELNAMRAKNGVVQTAKIEPGPGVEVRPIEFERAVVSDRSGALVVKDPELRKNTPDDKVIDSDKREVNVSDLTRHATKVDFDKVTTVDTFNTLNHYDQLLYVRQSKDRALLEQVVQASSKKQIQNEARKRMQSL